MSTKKQEDKNLYLSIVKQMIQLSTAGFGLVAALAWNNVIKEFVDTVIKPYLPEGSGIISLLVYAILVTVLAVVVTIYLSRLEKTLEKSNQTDTEK